MFDMQSTVSIITEWLPKAPRVKWSHVDESRSGDHICYYVDPRKMKSHYPAWGITKKLDDIFFEVSQSWMQRLAQVAGV